jgi:hypothetical protein
MQGMLNSRRKSVGVPIALKTYAKFFIIHHTSELQVEAAHPGFICKEDDSSDKMLKTKLH